ncbi:MAG: CAP domain-containing protein [bacterium]|nr:CAP domain-containing protein [bacterium]
MVKKSAKNKLFSKASARAGKFKDSDADGLSDADEINLGTNPNKADSDDDGVNDYEEVNIYGTDPLNLDTDGDGVKDGDEIKRGYNPQGPGLLNDLFIPCKYNNFKPRALHPQRLIFYSLSAILFKVILVGTVIILPVEAWLTPDILVEQGRQVISLTNTIRKNLNLALLHESQRLDQAAYDKAADMLINQYFSHTGPDSKTLADWLKQSKYNFTVAGENLAIGFAGPEEVVNGWTRSQTHYQNMVDPDFKEIGVGMVSGLYAAVDTTLVAQYFGAPVSQPSPADEVQPVKPAAQPPIELNLPAGQAGLPVKTASTTEILGEKVNDTTEVRAEPDLTPTATTSAASTEPSAVELPLIDQLRSKLYVDQPQGQDEKIVRAEVYLNSEAIRVQVNFNNYFINLKPEVTEAGSSAELTTSTSAALGTDTLTTLGTGKWVGQTIIFKEDREQIFNPVVLASVSAEDQAGNRVTEDLTWDNIRPAKTTLLKQYYFIKQHQSPYIAPLFDATSIFYKMILIVALIALGLNVFVHVKKQHPRVILSTLGLIVLLAILIIL